MHIGGIEIRRKRDKEIEDSIYKMPIQEEDDYSIFDADYLGNLGIDKKDSHKLGTLINKLRERSNKRKDRYKDYKELCKDPIIGQAIEMMADDATQFDVDRERTVWVESPDKEYAQAINDIIEDYIEPFIDTLASNIISKGEFVFKVNKNELGEPRGKYQDVVLIPYKHLEFVHHLIMPDRERMFYIVDDITKVQPDQDVSDNFREYTDFLHFINYSIDNSTEVSMKVEKTGSKAQVVDVFILQGESILTEKLIETNKILKLIENSIIKFRLAKSKLVRFVNLNVNRLADNKKVQALVNYVHGAIVASEAIGQQGYESTTSQSDPVVVTIPVKNEVGKITIEEFNSDVNIKDIADLDYFLNKEFAALRTPRSYFNFDEALPGMGVSGASLARIDIRYARAVKKVQRVIVNGIKDLVDIFNEANGIEEKNAPKITVKIVKVASSEDYDRYTEYEQRLTMANQVVQGLVSPETGEVSTQLISIYVKFFTHVVPNSEMVEFLTSLTKKANIQSKPDGVKLTGLLK